MKLLIAPLLLLFTLSLSNSYAQDIQIDGKTFQTVKKTVLNTEIEYYQVKEKSNTASGSQSYIKTGGVFTKTIFSEAELKKLVSTGKASSLGVVKERQVNDKHKIAYILKSTILVLITVKEKTIQFLEIDDKYLSDVLQGKIKVAGRRILPGEEPGTFGGCTTDCWDDRFGDIGEGGTNAGCIGDKSDCDAEYLRCYEACKTQYGIPNKPGNSINLYAITLKGLAISIK